MANIKIIDLPTGSPESTSFVEATQVDELAESGRSTVKLALNALGNFVAGQGASPLEYGDLETESTTLIGGVNELHGVGGYDVYDNTATYAVGDICIHSNSLQVCTTAVTVAEDFDSDKWAPTTIKALLALKQNSTDNSLTTNNKQIVPAINELDAIYTVKNFQGNAPLNINDCVTGYVYWANSNAYPYQNLPTSGAFHIVTFKSISTHGFQLAIPNDGGRIWIRILANGSWNTWKYTGLT